MVTKHSIQSFVRQLVGHFAPERVVLFGSYAYGRPTEDSDVDLLVVMPHDGPPALKAAEIRRRIRAGFPMDLVVRSPAELRRRLAMGDPFLSEIAERGESLYEARHTGVDRKG